MQDDMAAPRGEAIVDESLLTQVASGDERAFETLYGWYAAAVRAFVRMRVSDAGAAEEICAGVWLGCWRSAKAFRGDAKVLSWLLAIAKRQIYMRVRRVRPSVTALDDAPEMSDGGPGPETSALSEAEVDDLTAMLRRLPDELVETATLAWLHDLPYRQIADLWKCRRARSSPVSHVHAVCYALNSATKTVRMERNGEPL